MLAKRTIQSGERVSRSGSHARPNDPSQDGEEKVVQRLSLMRLKRQMYGR